MSTRITEQFTFRACGRHVTIDDAAIDTGADRTIVTAPIVEGLRLHSHGA